MRFFFEKKSGIYFLKKKISGIFRWSKQDILNIFQLPLELHFPTFKIIMFELVSKYFDFLLNLSVQCLKKIFHKKSFLNTQTLKSISNGLKGYTFQSKFNVYIYFLFPNLSNFLNMAFTSLSRIKKDQVNFFACFCTHILEEKKNSGTQHLNKRSNYHYFMVKGVFLLRKTPL